MQPSSNHPFRKGLSVLALVVLGLTMLSLPRFLPSLKFSPKPPPPPSAQSLSFPLDHTDQLGRIVHLAQKPERVITMTPSITETLFALGAGKQVVACSKHCKSLPCAQSLPSVGDINQPTIEVIRELKPDLILTTEFTPRPVVDSIANLGIPIIVTKLGNLDQTWENMKTLGRLVGHDQGGATLALQNQQACQSLRDFIAKNTSTKPKTLLFYGISGYYSAGKGTFASELLEWAGAENLANRAASPWPQLSQESILEWNPDCILFTCANTPTAQAAGKSAIQALLQNPQWQSVQAIKNQQVFLVDADPFTIQGVKMPIAIESAARLLHPNLPWNHPAH